MAHLGTAAAVSPLLSTQIGKFSPKVFDAFVLLLILRKKNLIFGPFYEFILNDLFYWDT